MYNTPETVGYEIERVTTMRFVLGKTMRVDVRFIGPNEPTPQHIAMLREYLGVAADVLCPAAATQEPR